MGAKTPEIENCAAIESRYHPCRSTLTRTYLASTAPYYSPHWHATTLSLRVVCTRLPRGIQNLGYLTLGINLPHCVGQHRLLLSAGRRIQLHGAGEATVGEP